MATFSDRNPDWIRWIAPEHFNDQDLFKIVIFLSFILRAPIYPQWEKLWMNMVGVHLGGNRII